ncbi:MAG TPA: riboflavin synthase [Gemmatimonadota bacterium]|nr:riboflavin synthase [Gemmatimonadota bacterium]
MFTGIIDTIGVVQAIEPLGEGRRLRLSAPWATELATGESVAVAGVCLTVTEAGADTFLVEAVRETIRRTTLGSLQVGRRIHLERALAVGDRIGGHFVQGHVDCVGTVRSMERQGENRYLSVSLPTGRELAAPRGSIAVDGVSLTILDADPGGVRLSIVPHTWGATAFPDLTPGDGVNVEYDMIARYLKHLVEGQPVADLGARTG